MRRAAVLIGVKQAGNLPLLNAVGSGLALMADWAASQGISGKDLRILSDEDGTPVRAHEIYDAIDSLPNFSAITQLIVYFSGHGVHNNGERWLLSMAPDSTGEAVNVEGSIKAAREMGIPHVILISDACRNAASDIRMQQVEGTNIFPNRRGSGKENFVDVFFACARGSVALEVANIGGKHLPYTALYTDVLSQCLSGKAIAAVDFETEAGLDVALVRAWKLSDYLDDAVPVRLEELLGTMPLVSQLPDARITSRNGWLSRLTPGAGLQRPPDWKMRSFRSTTRNARTVAVELLRAALGDLSEWRSVMSKPTARRDVGQLKSLVKKLLPIVTNASGIRADPIVVHGATVAALHANVRGQPLHASTAAQLRAAVSAGACTRVLVVTSTGTSVLVPVIAGMPVELVFEQGVLIDMVFHGRRSPLRPVEAFRASLAAAANLGVLRVVDSEEEHGICTADMGALLTGDMLLADPSIALYLAYAFYETHSAGANAMLAALLADGPASSLFDVYLLAGRDRHAGGTACLPVPLISQGWSLLSASKIDLPAPLRGLEQHLMPSHWTLFNSRGTELLIAAIAAGAI